jgi:hypothetical protein
LVPANPAYVLFPPHTILFTQGRTRILGGVKNKGTGRHAKIIKDRAKQGVRRGGERKEQEDI